MCSVMKRGSYLWIKLRCTHRLLSVGDIARITGGMNQKAIPMRPYMVLAMYLAGVKAANKNIATRAKQYIREEDSCRHKKILQEQRETCVKTPCASASHKLIE